MGNKTVCRPLLFYHDVIRHLKSSRSALQRGALRRQQLTWGRVGHFPNGLHVPPGTREPNGPTRQEAWLQCCKVMNLMISPPSE